ncbi:hypothetical protein NLI96_g5438 [Meripilus lineatus]|uniref:C2H2-type domain-containing protein n=1 Tax=Meripilus lineatus TaxID=2056292 RepID=A0AAD5V2V0_9APHY|nr:hypothetical protein NLI96_g5438 [Physisporinus lineatus]
MVYKSDTEDVKHPQPIVLCVSTRQPYTLPNPYPFPISVSYMARSGSSNARGNQDQSVWGLPVPLDVTETDVYLRQQVRCQYVDLATGEQCPRTLGRGRYLKRHELVHKERGDRPLRYKCQHAGCDYWGKQAGALTAHTRKHTGERLKCGHIFMANGVVFGICAYQAIWASQITRHKQTYHDYVVPDDPKHRGGRPKTTSTVDMKDYTHPGSVTYQSGNHVQLPSFAELVSHMAH